MDWFSGLVGAMVSFLILCVFLAIIIRATFQLVPAPLPYFAQQQIQHTQKQVVYANEKLYRIEGKLGTDPSQKKNKN